MGNGGCAVDWSDMLADYDGAYIIIYSNLLPLVNGTNARSHFPGSSWLQLGSRGGRARRGATWWKRSRLGLRDTASTCTRSCPRRHAKGAEHIFFLTEQLVEHLSPSINCCVVRFSSLLVVHTVETSSTVVCPRTAAQAAHLHFSSHYFDKD